MPERRARAASAVGTSEIACARSLVRAAVRDARVDHRDAHSTEMGAAMYLIDRRIKRRSDAVRPKRYVGKRNLESASMSCTHMRQSKTASC